MAAASRAPAAAAGAVGAVSAANIIDPLVGATAAATLNSVFQLKHGCKAAVTIPAFGLGVYQAPQGDPCVIAVEAAIKAGVRHFDTARIYGNESSVGAAIRKSGLRREEVFVTTKLWNADHGYDSTLAACERSLKQLGLDYLDLYLVHWPVQGKRLDTWRAMEKLLELGKVRAIGVSNYMVRHLEELFAHCKVRPAVNQIEVHPYLPRLDVVNFCHKHGIVVEAYSPLTKGEKLGDPPLVEIAAKYKKTTAQLLIRYALQRGCVVLPKSVTPKRIVENTDVFDFHISAEDMAALNALDEHLATGWDPTDAP